MAGSIKVETTITVTLPQGDIHTFNTSKTIGSLTAIDMRDFAIVADQTRILWDPVNDALYPASYSQGSPLPPVLYQALESG